MTPEPTADPRMLGFNDAHVWFARLDVDPSTLQEWQLLLSADERSRAARFLRAADANRFVASRASLRLLLSTYVGTAPADLRFEYSPQGKPELAGAGRPGLRFKLSHSGDLAMVGLAREKRVGVDVEKVRPETVTDGLARDIMSAAEFRTFSLLPTEQRVEAFFNCWTRKEAFLKARGDGLACPLNEVEVTFAPGSEPRLVRAPGESEPSVDWLVSQFQPVSEYVAAIAIEGRDANISRWIMPSRLADLGANILCWENISW